MAARDEGVFYPQLYEQAPGSDVPTPAEAAVTEERRSYYVSFPIRFLTSDVAQEQLERLALYYTIFGGVFVVVGVVGIAFPLLFALAVEQLIAWLLILGGGVSLLHFVLVCGAPGTSSFLLLGILHLGVGFWMLLQPIAGGTLLVYVLVGWFLAHGVVKLLLALQVRTMSSWPAVVVSGLISIVLAFTILALAPKYGIRLVGIVFGTDLVVSGLCMLLVALMAYLGRPSHATRGPREPLLSEPATFAAQGA